MGGGEFMHKLYMLSIYVLPALAIASFFSRLKGGTGIAGFSSGN
jgi:hypothetical protein